MKLIRAFSARREVESLRSAYCNIPPHLLALMDRQLLNVPNHPLAILKAKLSHIFAGFKIYDQLSPVVSVAKNFDQLLIPKEHISRSKSDTYYVNEETVLRTHSTAN
jgi:phenylalanyl-tRNA synthetase alpha chain